MQLSVCIPCFYSCPAHEAVRAIGALGFRCAEAWMWTDFDMPALKAALKDTGVTLISMCTTDFTMNAPEHRETWLKALRESCLAARELGVKRLITQVGQDTGAPRTTQHEAIVSALREAAPILEDAGITLMIEPLNAKYDHPGTFLTGSEEAADIVREIRHPNVKMVFDIYHQQATEGDIINRLLGQLDAIGHIHAAGHPGRHELSLGEINYPYILRAARDAGYTGFVGLEYTPTTESGASLAQARALLKDVIKD